MKRILTIIASLNFWRIALVMSLLMLAATVSFAGTGRDVMEAPWANCRYVPPKTACLSACADVWLKSDVRISDGIVGFHKGYMRDDDGKLAENATAKLLNFIQTMLYIGTGMGEHVETTMTKTLPRSVLAFDGVKVSIMDFGDFEALRKEGWTIKNSVDGLECDAAQMRAARLSYEKGK